MNSLRPLHPLHAAKISLPVEPATLPVEEKQFLAEPLAGRHCASGAATFPNQPGSPVNRLHGEDAEIAKKTKEPRRFLFGFLCILCGLCEKLFFPAAPAFSL